jgi:hypothetical protein
MVTGGKRRRRKMRMTMGRMLELEHQTHLSVTPRALRGVRVRVGREIGVEEVRAAALRAPQIKPVELDLWPGWRASNAGSAGYPRWHFVVSVRGVQFIAELGHLPRSENIGWLATWDVYDVTGLPRVWSVDATTEPWCLN